MPEDLSPQSLAQRLDGLAASGNEGRINVRLVQAAPYVAVGRDFVGRAVFVFDPLPGGPAFRTQHAEFLPAAELRYDASSPAAVVEERALLFYDEQALGGAYQELLPSLAWGMYDARHHLGEQAAIGYVAGLARLLREATEPLDVDALQGLWAEILVVVEASDPALLVEAWHEDPDETYDFAHGNERLEVKSTRGGRRRHRFSDTQLPPSPGSVVTVASVMVQRAAGGATALDLLVKLKGRLTVDQYETLLRKALVAMPLTHLVARAYDAEYAAANVRFFDGLVVPAVVLPEHVLEASWVADLEHLAAAGAVSGALSRAALPLSG